MKFKEILGIAFLAIVYIAVINKTILLYFFPDPELNIIFQDFRQQEMLIETIFTIIVLSVVPLFYFARKESRKKLEKVVIPTITLFSVIIPIFVFVNNYFTGNLLFSIALLVYGIIFTIVAFKFR